MPSSAKYHDILGIPPGSSIVKIKQAYRKRAKELHPDLNDSPDAHEQFILLTEAYEYLTSPGPKAKPNRPSYSHRKETRGPSYEERVKRQREEARKRARYYAKMRYEKFRQTDHYKKTRAFWIVMDHLYVISCIFTFSIPFIALAFWGWKGLLFGGIFVFFSSHYWAGLFTEKRRISAKEFSQSLQLILKTNTFRHLAFTALNIFLFLAITMNTQLSQFAFAISLGTLYFIAYLCYRFIPKWRKKLTLKTLYVGIVPGLFNLFFLFNYTFSSKPVREKYSFVHQTDSYRGQIRKLSFIHLQDYRYEEYPWFRFFPNFETMKNKKEITYHFEEGLFGLRVVKGYEFH